MRASTTTRSRSVAAADNGSARAHLREAAETTREGVRDLGTAARELASSELRTLGDQATKLRDGALARVAEKPLQALLIAAGAGALLGLLLRRR